MSKDLHNLKLKDIPQYLKVFQTHLGKRIYLVFLLALAAAIAEGVGIVMLLPLLQSLDGSMSGQANVAAMQPLTGIGAQVEQLLVTLGLIGSTVTVLIIITVAFLVKGGLLFASQGYSAYLTGQLMRELKSKMFNCYSQMNYEYYARRNTGHFINVIDVQIGEMLTAFTFMVGLGVQVVNAFIYTMLAFLVAWRFGLMALVIGVALLFLFRRLNQYVATLSRKTSVENGRLAKLLIQSLQAFKYLTATGKMGQLRVGIMDSIFKLTAYQIRSGVASAVTDSIREPIAVVSIMIIVIFQMLYLQEPLAPIMVSIVLFNRGLNAMMGVQTGLQYTMNRIGGVEMVRDEFNAQSREQEANGNKTILALDDSIILDKVQFSYSDDKAPVLRDVSLRIPVRTSVAFVGESGAGKSTLVDVITLMLKPQKGRVQIDHVPGEQIQHSSWRQQIGYVSQETAIFDDTLANNICLLEGDINHDELLFDRIREAARQANIDHYIDTLPDGYNSLVGERGLLLSGGQRQRLFIARELFKRPSLLILDEATSALDSESERFIQDSIDGLKGKITVVMIAHRLSTIRNVDHVYVFDQGRLVEDGGYQELKNNVNSRLSSMIKMQSL